MNSMNVDGSKIIFFLGVAAAVVTAGDSIVFFNSLKINHQRNKEQ